MKRKLLAAIMLIVLAFGVMAFAACDDSDTLKISSYDNKGGACGLSPDVQIAVEAKKEYSVDEPYIVNVEYGSTTYVSEDVERTVGYLQVYNLNGDVKFSGLKDIMQLETLLEIPSFLDESNRVYYEYKNGKECGFIFNASAEIEIPKDCITGTSCRVQIALVVVYLDEKGNCIGYEGPAVSLKYEISNGKIHFSK